jgi:periplasmic copper chaperone A
MSVTRLPSRFHPNPTNKTMDFMKTTAHQRPAAKAAATIAFTSIALGSFVLLAGCGSSTDTDADSTVAVETTVAQASPAESPSAESASADSSTSVELSDVWARTSPSMSGVGAMYFVAKNSGGETDAIVSVSVPAEIAKTVELHETVMGAPTSDGAEPMMSMQPVASIEVPAGGETMLKPGGFHVMLLEMPSALTVGQKFEATVTFQNAGAKTVEVEVRDQ